MPTYEYFYLDPSNINSFLSQSSPQTDDSLEQRSIAVLNQFGQRGWKVIYFNVDDYFTYCQAMLMRKVSEE